MTQATLKIIELYEQGFSSYQVAALVHRKPDSIRHILRYAGVIRESKGRDIERLVAKWFKDRKFNVLEMPGDRPYDLLVEGLRIDVKSSTLHKDDKFNFELIHDLNKHKNNAKSFDLFLFVLLEDEMPMYLLGSSLIETKMFSWRRDHKTKYPLVYLGDLNNYN